MTTRSAQIMLTAALLCACGDSNTHPGSPGADAGTSGGDAASEVLVGDDPDGATPADATSSETGCVCDDLAPVCLGGECVACTEAVQGACRGTTPFCSTDHRCVACLADTDCPEGNTPVCRAGTCSACADDSECGDGRICDSGHCGECASGRSEACTAGGVAHVCDVLARTCSTALAGSAGPCEICVSDAHCAPDLACVEHSFAGKIVGTFCMPKKDTAACSRPYTEPAPNVSTIEGAVVAVCTPKLASCPALAGASGYGAPCGVDASGIHVTTGAVRGDDGLCGMKGVDDALCVESNRPLDFRCTLPCADGGARNANLCPAQSHDFPGQAPRCTAADHYPAGADVATGFVCGF